MRGLGYERAVLPLLALGAVLLACVSDPGSLAATLALVAAGLVHVASVLTRLSIRVAVPLVVVLTVLATVGGSLEPGFFLLSLAVLGLTSTLRFDAVAWLLLAMLVGAPWFVLVIGDDGLAAGIWTMGIVFPAALGWGLQRQTRLTEELATARYELAERAVEQERQRIAREVHDLVGHGLAATLLQVASARHVLRRDPDSADEALEYAERIGRASMSELRATLATMREGTTPDERSLPRLTDLDGVLATAREQGLDVTFRAAGDPESVSPMAGLTVVRIAQEALTNALKHAPRSPTVVSLDTTGDDVLLDVTSRGAQVHSESAGGYGILGMRERAQAVGGELEAGPTDAGWRVTCRIPARGAAT